MPVEGFEAFEQRLEPDGAVREGAADFTIDPTMQNPWVDPLVGDDEAVKYVLATGSLYGSPARVRDQVAELRDAGVQHLLCQTGFGDMSHEQNLASMRRFGEEVMPAFRT